MIGGGSLLSGLIERLEKNASYSIQLGKIKIMRDKNLSNSAVLAPVAGLAMLGYKRSLGYSLSTNGHAHWTKRIANRVREVYHEYF